MSLDLNEVNLLGRITSEVEVKETPSGNKVTNFSVATNERFTDKQGEVKEMTTFHNVVIWGKLAEILESYARKGSRVFLKGKIQTRSWDADDGTKRYKTEILGSNVILLDSKKDNEEYEEKPQETGAKKPVSKKIVEGEINIEDIPF